MRRFALALGLLALAACDSSEIGPQPLAPQPDGKTAVFLTDAPFPFDDVVRVHIHVKEIALSEAADSTEGDLSWVVVASPDRTFNLLGPAERLDGAVGGDRDPAGPVPRRSAGLRSGSLDDDRRRRRNDRDGGGAESVRAGRGGDGDRRER